MNGNGHAPRERVTLHSIRIQRAPGIEGGFALTDFGPGVTIIHGPNGSGKSTTARAIHSLLWPEPANDDCLIEATFTYASSRWSLRRDGRSVRSQRDGVHCAPLTFDHLTRDTRDRYHLALHDLLSADDEQFAKLVTREASGGFDLEAAAKALQFDSIPSKPSTRPLNDAQKTLHIRKQAQERLRHDEATLASLQEQSAVAAAARLRLTALSALKQALTERAGRDEALAKFNRFDTGMYHVKDGDERAIAEWKQAESRLRQRLADHDATIDREQGRLANTGLPLDKNCASLINILKDQISDLRESEEARRESEQTLATARQFLGDLRANIAPLLPESLHTAAAVEQLRALDEAVSRQQEAATLNAAEALVAGWIPRPDGVPDPESFREAIRALSGWLRTPAPTEEGNAPAASIPALIGAAIIVVQGVLLGLSWHPAAYGFVLAGLAVALIALSLRRSESFVDDRDHFVSQFRRLGFEEPASWTESDVSSQLDALVRDYIDERAAEKNAEQWATLAPRLARREQAAAEALAMRNNVEATMGAPVQLDSHALDTIAASLERLVKESQDLARLEHRHAIYIQAEDEALITVNGTLHELGAEQVTNGIDAGAAWKELDERLTEAKRAQAAISEAIHDRDTRVRPELARLEAGRAAMIERYAGRRMEEIEALAGRHVEWLDALRAFRNRQEQYWSRCAQLAPGDDLADWTVERVQTEIAANEAIYERSTELNQLIGSISGKIEQAKASDDIEEALSAVNQAREQLAERRDDYLIKSIGGLVLEQVSRETREANLPEVARRARDLFATMTHGRYLLNFNPGSPPSFSATDTTTGIEQSLDELSSATRVQLLIAVRAAFVETSERDASLPMIFDETLANADAARAEALIETTFRLCESGRQIFYFTAQLDEVEKWRAMAQLHEIELTVIDLGATRKLAAAGRQSLADLDPIERPRVPAPDGLSRIAYGQLLGVPPLNLWSEEANGGDIHLWHLVDDLTQLHRLVGEQHIARWGQIRRLTVDGAVPALGIDRDMLERMSARADACLALIEAARIGRGRPVTSRHLHASNGMTERYTADCLHLLEECEGDGRRFIECLKNRAIAGFQSKNIDRFIEYFEENGHIVPDAMLPAEEIRVRVIRRMSDAIERNLIDLPAIDRLLAEACLTDDTAQEPVDNGAVLLSGSD